MLEAIVKSTKRGVLATDAVIMKRTRQMVDDKTLQRLQAGGYIKAISRGRWYALKDAKGERLALPEAAKRYEKQKTPPWNE